MSADTLLKLCTAAVAAYAAVVSTAALGWNIYDAVRKNRGRLKVEGNIAFGFSVSMLEGARNTGAQMRIDVTNIGFGRRYIYEPILEFNRDIGGKGERRFAVTKIFGGDKFPLALDSGGTYNRTFPLADLFSGLAKIGELKESDKFRVVVRDTLNKKHKSSRKKIKRLAGYLKI